MNNNDSNSFNFPLPPQQMSGNYNTQTYTSNGNNVRMDIYPPHVDPAPNNTTGAAPNGTYAPNFSYLIGDKPVTVPIEHNIITDTNSGSKVKKKKSSKKSDDGNNDSSSESITIKGEENNPADTFKATVEGTNYNDAYSVTNRMAYNIIQQSDTLINECKNDLDYMRSQRAMKGKYHYINATLASMSSLMSTKLAAIKEINSSIKNANDAEYRRYKDMKAATMQVDDNQAIMNAYSAFISAPVGAPAYQLPTTMDMTGGLGNIIRADYPDDVQKGMDMNMANYINNLSPEENLMLQDNNPNLEEVLLYDQATGMKRFAWVDTRDNKPVANMPVSSNLVVEDFVIDPRTRIARNTNLNMTKRVVIMNEGSFDKF